MSTANRHLYIDAFRISPWSYTASVVLREKGLEFDQVELKLHEGEHKQDKYKHLLPIGKIPALVDGTTSIAESLAIVEYLEETYASPKFPRVLPATPEARAKARMVMSWIRSDLGALRDDRPTTTMFYEKATQPLSAAGAAAADRLLAVTDQLLPTGANYLCGEWCIADSELAFMLQRLAMNGHRMSARIGNYIETQWSRPSVRAFTDKPRPAYQDY